VCLDSQSRIKLVQTQQKEYEEMMEKIMVRQSVEETKKESV